ncbi:glycosyltransferase, partial [Bacteroidota bacterium]
MGEMISLCMISKDEEEFIKDCLTSVKDIVDEIILVDTGSTDRTVQIAESFGAKIFRSKWDNDFSKPRNESLSHASHEWILLLDPDEAIAEQDFSKIREAIKRKGKIAYELNTINYTYETKPVKRFFEAKKEYANYNKGMPYFWCSTKVRLFRKHKNVKFTGVVHEMVEPSLKENNFEILRLDAPVHHYTNLNLERSRKKRFFYLNISKKKLEREPDNPKAYLELGREYVNCKLFHRAIQCLKKGIPFCRTKKDDDVKTLLLSELGLTYLIIKKHDLAEKYLLEAINTNKPFINIKSYEGLLKLYETLGNPKKLFKTYSNFGMMLSGMKKYDGAIPLLRTALDIKPDLCLENYETYRTLQYCYNKNKEEDKAQSLKIPEIKGSIILCYHEIGEIESEWSLPFEEFKRQILFLKKKDYKFVTLDNIIPKEKSIAITFDDGRKSVYTKVYPFLKQNKINATLFITPDWADKKNIPEIEKYSDFMNWSEIKELSDDGFVIGSHGLSHKNLKYLDDNSLKK